MGRTKKATKARADQGVHESALTRGKYLQPLPVRSLPPEKELEKIEFDLPNGIHVVAYHKDWTGIVQVTMSTPRAGGYTVRMPGEVIRALGGIILREELCNCLDFMKLGRMRSFVLHDGNPAPTTKAKKK